MLALRVIEHLDIIEHIPSSLVTCFVNPAANPLSLEQIEETFNDSVVVAVTPAAHRSLEDRLHRQPFLRGSWQQDAFGILFKCNQFAASEKSKVR